MTGEKNKEYKSVKLSDLVEYERNNKKHGINIDEIVKSIKANTYITPIVVDENNIILAGHGRKLALEKMGETDADVLVVTGLTETQKRDFRIRDNKLTELSERDFDNLKFELEELDIPELSDLFKDVEELEEEVEAKEDDYEIPETITTDIVLGDLFEIGEHRLLCGDSTDAEQVAQLMNGEKADMVFTDPPYGVDYQGGALTKRRKLDNDQKNTNIYQEVIPVIYSFTTDKAPIYIWHAAGYADMATHLGDNGIEIRSQLVRNKNMAQFGALSAQYKQKHEPCFYCFKRGQTPNWYGPTNEVTVWDVKRESKNEFHPTQKPIELAERALNNSSEKNNRILDLFLGSGSTMVASHQLKRKCYGMELDPKYCQVIIDRMIRLDPELTIKKNGAERDHATGDYTLLSS